MNIFRNNKISERRGFTLAETLLTVAIVAILLTVAIPGVVGLSRRQKLTSLDDGAHAVFMAAQSSLMSMKSAGEDISVLCGDKVDFGDYATEVHGDYYAVSDGEKLSRLIPGGVSSAAQDAKYVVEISPDSGAVYAVWYWEEEDFDYLTQAYRTDGAAPSREARLGSGLMVGYYGGSEVERPAVTDGP